MMKVLWIENIKKIFFSLTLQHGIRASLPRTFFLFASSLNQQYLLILVVFRICRRLFIYCSSILFFIYIFFLANRLSNCHVWNFL